MKYEEACSRGAVTTEQFKQIMANASASAKEYAIETKGVAGSTDVFVNKQKESISAMQASAKATVGTGTALKTLGRTLVSMGAYTLIFTVISKVVGLAATAIDNYVHRVEKANDAMDEAGLKPSDYYYAMFNYNLLFKKYGGKKDDKVIGEKINVNTSRTK